MCFIIRGILYFLQAINSQLLFSLFFPFTIHVGSLGSRTCAWLSDFLGGGVFIFIFSLIHFNKNQLMHLPQLESRISSFMNGLKLFVFIRRVEFQKHPGGMEKSRLDRACLFVTWNVNLPVIFPVLLAVCGIKESFFQHHKCVKTGMG